MSVYVVGDGHLSYSEHATPSTVGVIVGGGHNFVDFIPIGHEYEEVVALGIHFGLANQIY